MGYPAAPYARIVRFSALVLVLVLVLAGYLIYAYTRPTPRAREEVLTGAPESQVLAAAPATGPELYANYCAGCHGEKGDGNGPAARYLYPKPRNFGANQFRIVSTTNRRPTDEDLLYVLDHGMPGSAMFPFAHLAPEERQALISHVRVLMRQALEEQVRRQAAERGESEDEPEALAATISQMIQPGSVLAVSEAWPPSVEAVPRGRELYLKVCGACHGETGRGDGAQEQRNDDGTLTRPRDFTRGIFKGGRDPQQLYRRIMLGMPGSPMPSSLTSLPEAQVRDLVAFVLSLSDAGTQGKVEHRRVSLVARRVAESLPDPIPEDAWRDRAGEHVVVSPLWWRDYPEPDLRVQALHDGRSLAVRLTWHDATRNDQAVRPQDFEDMAAVQLFKGLREPFLGMGMANQAVEVWLWRAGGGGNPTAYADVDTAYPNMAVDLYPFERPGRGPRPHAPELQPPEFVTARAAGNLRADPAAPFTGDRLQAQGFGSLTFRPWASQVVQAGGRWQDGRWTVTLRRPLQVSPEEAGLELGPGDRVAIAFALWDGAARDRNGQKLVSIWHDLHLE
jgi:mono/diheme cytochrome c family protein